MFKTVSELQEFILWAKKERLESFKAGEVEVTFSAYAFIDAISEISPDSQPLPSHKTEERNTSKTLVDTLSTEDEDEELLFFSAKP